VRKTRKRKREQRRERTQRDTFLRNTIFWNSFCENHCERIAVS